MVDSRHPITNFDCMMVEAAAQYHLNLHILLTKSDKINNSERAKAQRLLADYLKQVKAKDNITFQLFSSLKKTGLEQLKAKLNSWYQTDILEELESSSNEN